MQFISKIIQYLEILSSCLLLPLNPVYPFLFSVIYPFAVQITGRERGEMRNQCWKKTWFLSEFLQAVLTSIKMVIQWTMLCSISYCGPTISQSTIIYWVTTICLIFIHSLVQQKCVIPESVLGAGIQNWVGCCLYSQIAHFCKEDNITNTYKWRIMN